MVKMLSRCRGQCRLVGWAGWAGWQGCHEEDTDHTPCWPRSSQALVLHSCTVVDYSVQLSLPDHDRIIFSADPAEVVPVIIAYVLGESRERRRTVGLYCDCQCSTDYLLCFPIGKRANKHTEIQARDEPTWTPCVLFRSVVNVPRTERPQNNLAFRVWLGLLGCYILHAITAGNLMALAESRAQRCSSPVLSYGTAIHLINH